MNKINFVNNQEPAISAENLNQMQDNIEEIGVAVSPTEPTTGEKVWIQKGKNLIDISTLLNGYVDSYGNIELNNLPNGEKYSKFIPVKPNTTYTFKIFETSEDYAAWFGVGEYSTQSLSSFIKRITNSTSTATSITFTTSETTNYIIISGRNLVGATKIQLEQNTEATEYEEYIEKKIYCKNDNGIFEEFVNAETIGIETITNRNGTAIKYPDGTLICIKNTSTGGTSSAPSVDITTASGSSYRSTSIVVGEFPVPFKELYYNRSSFVACQGHYDIWQGNNPNGGTTERFANVILLSNRSVSTWDVNIRSIAIGRWK